MDRGGVGGRLWALLVLSFVALGVFSHLAYGASLGASLIGVGTTVAVLVVILGVASASNARNRDPGRRS